jgi:hypothetical protein
LNELFVKNSANSLTLTVALPFFVWRGAIIIYLQTYFWDQARAAAVAIAAVVALFISRFKNSGTKVRKTVNEYVHPGLVKFLTLSNVFDKKHFYLLKRVH